MDLCFAVHKLEKFSSNPAELNFEVLVNLLRYITDNINLELKYYEKIEDAPLSDILIQASIQTENQLMVFSDYIWQYFPYTGRVIGSYIVFYQCGPINHCTHVPGPAEPYSSES